MGKEPEVSKGPTVYAVFFTDAAGKLCLSRYFSTVDAAGRWKRHLEKMGYTSVEVQQVR